LERKAARLRRAISRWRSTDSSSRTAAGAAVAGTPLLWPDRPAG